MTVTFWAPLPWVSLLCSTWAGRWRWNRHTLLGSVHPSRMGLKKRIKKRSDRSSLQEFTDTSTVQLTWYRIPIPPIRNLILKRNPTRASLRYLHKISKNHVESPSLRTVQFRQHQKQTPWGPQVAGLQVLLCQERLERLVRSDEATPTSKGPDWAKFGALESHLLIAMGFMVVLWGFMVV